MGLTWRTLLGGALILFGTWQIARKPTAAPAPETTTE
jgi:hypothetical protein